MTMVTAPITVLYYFYFFDIIIIIITIIIIISSGIIIWWLCQLVSVVLIAVSSCRCGVSGSVFSQLSGH